MNKDDQLLITSTQNPRIKALKGLQKRREREPRGLIMIEGVREVERAASAGTALRELFICPTIFKEAGLKDLPAEVQLIEVSQHVYEKIAYRGGSEGIIAVAERPSTSLGSFSEKSGAGSLVLVLDGIEKPGNLGAVLRTADGAGVTGVIVTGGGTDIYSPNVIRASLGTVFGANICEAGFEEAAAHFEDLGIEIITSTPAAQILYHEADYKGPCAIVVGSEDRGASKQWLSAAGSRVRIPMNGAADSLNTSASASVLLYEAVRQRNA